MVERETAWKANNEEEDTSSTTDMDGRVSKGIVGMLVRYPLNHHDVLNIMLHKMRKKILFFSEFCALRWDSFDSFGILKILHYFFQTIHDDL